MKDDTKGAKCIKISQVGGQRREGRRFGKERQESSGERVGEGC